MIEAAGLARRSARGTLIDCFRDRAVFAVRDERGQIAGFIGRARPGAGEQVPTYMNSPQTAVYRKGGLLFGLWEGRGLLQRGAVAVIVEGPFDAIAVTEAGAGRYVGLAPCGTALTGRQVAALASMAGLERAGVLVALDGDRAGHEGIVRAYEVLLAHTSRLSAVILPAGRDPAEILQKDGAAALVEALRRTELLAQVVIDAHLDGWGQRLDFPEGQLAAMRSAARLVAATLPRKTVEAIMRSVGRDVTGALGHDLFTPVHPDLAGAAQLLPAGAIAQILRIAERTDSTHYEVTAEVVNGAKGAGGPRSPVSVVDRAKRMVMGGPPIWPKHRQWALNLARPAALLGRESRRSPAIRSRATLRLRTVGALARGCGASLHAETQACLVADLRASGIPRLDKNLP